MNGRGGWHAEQATGQVTEGRRAGGASAAAMGEHAAAPRAVSEPSGGAHDNAPLRVRELQSARHRSGAGSIARGPALALFEAEPLVAAAAVAGDVHAHLALGAIEVADALAELGAFLGTLLGAGEPAPG